MERIPKAMLLVIGVVACGPDHGGRPAPSLADLRADANRDGEVRFDDDSDANKTAWNAKTGAIFLANIDDDSQRCESSTSDFTIALCNDAQDDVVNGEDDARDLARLKTRPGPQPADATGRVVVATAAARDLVRLFKKTGTGPTDFEVITDDTECSREELEAGIELGIEAKDIVRDPAEWDGYVDVELTVSSQEKGVFTDTVRMRVAPVMTYHHLLPAETVWIPNTLTQGQEAMHGDLAAASRAAGLGEPQGLSVNDQWAQDFFEPAYMTMPGPGHSQHVMRVNYRSANIFNPKKKETPLRPAGRVVFALRGKDVAGVQQFDLANSRIEMDTLNSFGNFETVPPYKKDGVFYPFGRVLRGSTDSWHVDRAFATMVDAQGQQPQIEIDTSWLFVGHVDETISFVRAPSPRGWALLANDARLSMKMLANASRAGHGNVPMFIGYSWIDVDTGEASPAEVTIDQVLADREVMQASAEAAAEVDAQLAILKKEIGLTDEEIIKVPFLHTYHAGKSVAYQPGMVNGVYLSDTRFAAPDPHGPRIDGVDIFKAAFEESLGNIGINVNWVEDWDAYHRIFGEVHCGSNTTRRVPEARWWESGR
ncbi:MAG: protein-arginine deiminase [Myxococcales bacterium]|nr:protein-arginine deiminase [Myxococcales bacterium]